MSNKRTFDLKPNSEFIELMKLLKFEQVAQTGGHAKMLIEEGLVYVNKEQEFRKRRKLKKGDIVTVEDISIEIQ
ncbi:MAG: RNA-binding S4 domain-containing protein [Crocinitomicaceae bacterium]|nr:RNA-binding S4 domain-containing protein [Crocinitomicaceae bacterium]